MTAVVKNLDESLCGAQCCSINKIKDYVHVQAHRNTDHYLQLDAYDLDAACDTLNRRLDSDKAQRFTTLQYNV